MSMHVLPLFYSNVMCQNQFDMKCRVIDESDRFKVCIVQYGMSVKYVSLPAAFENKEYNVVFNRRVSWHM